MGHEYTKSVVEPIREVAPKKILRSFWDNYGDVHADVFHIAGETHHDRKPVCIPLQNGFWDYSDTCIIRLSSALHKRLHGIASQAWCSMR